MFHLKLPLQPEALRGNNIVKSPVAFHIFLAISSPEKGAGGILPPSLWQIQTWNLRSRVREECGEHQGHRSRLRPAQVKLPEGGSSIAVSCRVTTLRRANPWGAREEANHSPSGSRQPLKMRTPSGARSLVNEFHIAERTDMGRLATMPSKGPRTASVEPQTVRMRLSCPLARTFVTVAIAAR